MVNNYLSFENVELRGKYSRYIGELFEKNNINWKAFPSIKDPEIFIRPKDSPEENLRVISRISLQIVEGNISFGVSGYFPWQIKETKKILEYKGYKYDNYHGFSADGRPNGRWWLTKHLDNLGSLLGEFKDIEPILLQK